MFARLSTHKWSMAILVIYYTTRIHCVLRVSSLIMSTLQYLGTRKFTESFCVIHVDSQIGQRTKKTHKHHKPTPQLNSFTMIMRTFPHIVTWKHDNKDTNERLKCLLEWIIPPLHFDVLFQFLYGSEFGCEIENRNRLPITNLHLDICIYSFL